MNKYCKLKFRYFTKFDRVTTTLGEGVVVEDEKEIKTPEDLFSSKILIQHNNDCYQNPENTPILIDRICVSLNKNRNVNDEIIPAKIIFVASSCLSCEDIRNGKIYMIPHNKQSVFKPNDEGFIFLIKASGEYADYFFVKK